MAAVAAAQTQTVIGSIKTEEMETEEEEEAFRNGMKVSAGVGGGGLLVEVKREPGLDESPPPPPPPPLPSRPQRRGSEPPERSPPGGAGRHCGGAGAGQSSSANNPPGGREQEVTVEIGATYLCRRADNSWRKGCFLHPPPPPRGGQLHPERAEHTGEPRASAFPASAGAVRRSPADLLSPPALLVRSRSGSSQTGDGLLYCHP
ncbi:hypothetical protein chiPu_0024075, partial [Chiloscyllium punctatum]|nr:hypothetical protein [Chiloscyllium punctatum]